MLNQEVAQESWRDYRILHEIGIADNVSQRSLSDRVGIALGLTNQIVKRLIRKGLVKTSRINAKRISYFLTSRGLSEKLRLVIDYTRRTISFFTAVRQIARQKLAELRDAYGISTVALVGTGEIAEAVYLSAQEVGLRLVAVYADDGPPEWLGGPVLPLTSEPVLLADVVVVTGLDDLATGRAFVQRVAPVVLQMRELLDGGLGTFARRLVLETAERAGTSASRLRS